MLGDDIRAALPGLRGHAESRMTSTARVEAVRAGTDPLTGQVSAVVTATPHESIRCRVRTRSAGPPAVHVGGASVPESVSTISFPWDTLGLAPGLRVTILTSESPVLAGRVFRLTRPPDSEQLTAQRWEVETWPTTSAA